MFAINFLFTKIISDRINSSLKFQGEDVSYPEGLPASGFTDFYTV